MTPWLSVIGIGEDGLDALPPGERALVESAEVLIGGERHLAMVPNGDAERLTWRRPLEDTVEEIAGHRGKRVVVLATGDPMCYGIGVTLSRAFAPEEIAVLPAPGAFSLACARLGWPHAEVDGLTLHGRPIELLRSYLAPGHRLLILSHDGATPAAVARLLCDSGYGASEMIVLEHMGGDKERRVAARADAWPDGEIADLNTIAVMCRAQGRAKRYFGAPGLPDHAFENDGQLTKREVRAVTLSALAPTPGARLWDVGAGSGSIAIEWMLCARGAQATAIERDAARVATIGRNATALGVPALRVVHGEAPGALDGLDAPEAIFVGGGLSAPKLLEACWARLAPGGRLVANAVTLEGEAALLSLRETTGGALTRIAISRAAPIGARTGWRPLMPVTQFAATKPAADG